MGGAHAAMLTEAAEGTWSCRKNLEAWTPALERSRRGSLGTHGLLACTCVGSLAFTRVHQQHRFHVFFTLYTPARTVHSHRSCNRAHPRSLRASRSSTYLYVYFYSCVFFYDHHSGACSAIRSSKPFTRGIFPQRVSLGQIAPTALASTPSYTKRCILWHHNVGSLILGTLMLGVKKNCHVTLHSIIRRSKVVRVICIVRTLFVYCISNK